MSSQDVVDAPAAAAESSAAVVEFPIELEDAGGPPGQRAIHIQGGGRLSIDERHIRLYVRGVNRITFIIPYMGLSSLPVLVVPWLRVGSYWFALISYALGMMIAIGYPLWALLRRRTFTIDPLNQGIVLDPKRRRFYLEVYPGRWVCGVTGIKRIGPMMEELQRRFGEAVRIEPIPYWTRARMRRWGAILVSTILVFVAILCLLTFQGFLLGYDFLPWWRTHH